MKKIAKLMGFISMLVLVIALASCNNKYNFYKDWSEAGAVIEEDNIYSAITLDEAMDKIKANDKFILLTASSQSSQARSAVTTLQQQAEYLGFDGTIYFVDATDYVANSTLRGTLKNGLKLKKNYASLDQNAIVACYDMGVVTLDTTDTDEERGKAYLVDGTVNFERLAYYLFTSFSK